MEHGTPCPISRNQPLLPVSLLFPQSDLISDGGREVSSDTTAGEDMHLEEPDDLGGCYTSSEGLSAAVTGYHTNTQIRKPGI